jgi:hypothetical protein
MKYKALIISAALLVAPVAFAEDNQSGQGMPPPPHNEPGRAFFQMRFEGEGHGEQGNVMFTGAAGATTTPDGRPLPPPPGRPHMASSTGNTFFEAHGEGEGRGMRPRMMGTTTDEMGTSSEIHGTSTMPRPGIPGLFLGIFKRFFGGPHDNGNSSTTPPQMRGELNGEGHDGDINASSTLQVEASTTPRTPPAQVIEFFQNFFSRFFH